MIYIETNPPPDTGSESNATLCEELQEPLLIESTKTVPPLPLLVNSRIPKGWKHRRHLVIEKTPGGIKKFKDEYFTSGFAYAVLGWNKHFWYIGEYERKAEQQ